MCNSKRFQLKQKRKTDRINDAVTNLTNFILENMTLEKIVELTDFVRSAKYSTITTASEQIIRENGSIVVNEYAYLDLLEKISCLDKRNPQNKQKEAELIARARAMRTLLDQSLKYEY